MRWEHQKQDWIKSSRSEAHTQKWLSALTVNRGTCAGREFFFLEQNSLPVEVNRMVATWFMTEQEKLSEGKQSGSRVPTEKGPKEHQKQHRSVSSRSLSWPQLSDIHSSFLWGVSYSSHSLLVLWQFDMEDRNVEPYSTTAILFKVLVQSFTKQQATALYKAVWRSSQLLFNKVNFHTEQTKSYVSVKLNT